jgi:hypoxanthine phosphoribosyltransferase
MIQVLDKQFVPFMTAQQIAERNAQLGASISKDYEGKNPLLIGILNGSFMFASDLYKNVTIPSEISFVKLASYSGTTSTGHVTSMIGMDRDLFGRHVIIVEDIVDTGKTLSEFLPTLQHQGPASIAIATFLSKPEAHQQPMDLKYVGFEIPNRFVVGYGLDYDGYGRNLPELYQLANS